MISGPSEKPLACWRGKERYGNGILDCLTIIFKTTGCAWSRCRMCSYRHERYHSLSLGDLTDRLLHQLKWVKEQIRSDDYQMVKIFTSGSFFDPEEVPLVFRSKVAETFRGKLVIAETRPEFVTESAVTTFVEGIDDRSYEIPLYCAMGLETSNDQIREKCINKGFTFENFASAAAVARSAGAGVKAYLLLKPLFLSEGESVADMRTSILDVSRYADLISMNPCTVQRRTELEYYWKRGAYRPSYLWSILAILKVAPVPITCDPLGGGQKRGPHNCGKCDYEIVKGIRDYSLTGDRELINALLETKCSCKSEWQYILSDEMPYGMPLTR